MSEEEQSKQANQAGSSNNQQQSEQQKSDSKPKSAAKKQDSQAKQSKDTSKTGSSSKKQEKKQEEPPIEDKPFPEFIEQHFQPALKKALSEQGINDLALEFKKDEFPFPGVEECSQVVGQWDSGKRRFNLYFLEEDISGKKAFAYSASDAPPSTIESFMIDERKVNLELLVMYTVQRLNGQKWLALN